MPQLVPKHLRQSSHNLTYDVALNISDRSNTMTSREQVFLQLALDLSAALPHGQQNQKLIEAVVELFQCDAAALLLLQGDLLVPVAQYGLAPEIIGRQYRPASHPRLQQILSSNQPVRFASDSPLPDPFDGQLASDLNRLSNVHDCMGCSLYVEDTLVGALTMDALDVGVFDLISDLDVTMFSAIAAAQLRNATLLKQLKQAQQQQSAIAQDLVTTARLREGEITGNSACVNQLKQTIGVVAVTDLTVLICGETGTGKELVARTIHAQSPRSEQPLVHLNCAALAAGVAESELFGHVKGAFTGASSNRLGKFELAHQGTLFLDEIGELPLELQAKLLRALQQGEVQRVGSDRMIHVDVRVIAATNRSLEQEVEQGRFREDLFHRLQVFPIRVPSLSERLDDLPFLCGRFIQQAQHKIGVQELSLHPEALQTMRTYNWPGNVRELEHLILRAALNAKTQQRKGRVVIQAEHLGLFQQSVSSTEPIQPGQNVKQLAPSGFRDAVEKFQYCLISQAQKENDGVWSKSANALQMDRGNLYRLAKRLGLMSK